MVWSKTASFARMIGLYLMKWSLIDYDINFTVVLHLIVLDQKRNKWLVLDSDYCL